MNRTRKRKYRIKEDTYILKGKKNEVGRDERNKSDDHGNE